MTAVEVSSAEANPTEAEAHRIKKQSDEKYRRAKNLLQALLVMNQQGKGAPAEREKKTEEEVQRIRELLEGDTSTRAHTILRDAESFLSK